VPNIFLQVLSYKLLTKLYAVLRFSLRGDIVLCRNASNAWTGSCSHKPSRYSGVSYSASLVSLTWDDRVRVAITSILDAVSILQALERVPAAYSKAPQFRCLQSFHVHFSLSSVVRSYPTSLRHGTRAIGPSTVRAYQMEKSITI
jgi:hypothetical protein